MDTQKQAVAEPSCGGRWRLAHAYELMQCLGASMLPVTDSKGNVIGTLTEKEILSFLDHVGRSAREAEVGEVMLFNL